VYVGDTAMVTAAREAMFMDVECAMAIDISCASDPVMLWTGNYSNSWVKVPRGQGKV